MISYGIKPSINVSQGLLHWNVGNQVYFSEGTLNDMIKNKQQTTTNKQKTYA